MYTAQVITELDASGYAVVPGLLTRDQVEALRLEAETLQELALDGGAWGEGARASCVFEALPPHRCEPAAREHAAAFRRLRSAWPLRATAWEVLCASRLTQLVLELQGPGCCVLNEQVGEADECTGRGGGGGACPPLPCARTLACTLAHTHHTRSPPQYVIKPPATSAAAFAWHRDSDWLGEAAGRASYLCVWCALDDMTRANGCLLVRPGSHSSMDGQPSQQQQQQVEGVGGEVVELPMAAGTAVLMRDTLLHASGPNRTQHSRRAWMPQFASAPIRRPGGELVSLAVPLAPRPEGEEHS